MPMTRPPYSQILELVALGRTRAQLDREFGCLAQTITNWMKRAAARGLARLAATRTPCSVRPSARSCRDCDARTAACPPIHAASGGSNGAPAGCAPQGSVYGAGVA